MKYQIFLGRMRKNFVTFMMSLKGETGKGKIFLRIPKSAKSLPSSGEKSREWKKKLLERREAARTGPYWMIKFYLGWNALMITACCKAFSALGEESYRELAIKTYGFPGGKNEGEGHILISIIAIRKEGVWKYRE